MRIGHTNYYATQTTFYGSHPRKVEGYVLIVYGKTQQQINEIRQEMHYYGIHPLQKNFYQDLPLPVLQIQNPTDMARLEQLFIAQGISLDPKRFEQPNDWEKILDQQENLGSSLLNKLSSQLER